MDGHRIVVDRMARDCVLRERDGRAFRHVHHAAVFHDGVSGRAGGDVQRRARMNRRPCDLGVFSYDVHIAAGQLGSISDAACGNDDLSACHQRIGRQAAGLDHHIARGDRSARDRCAVQDVHVPAPVPAVVENRVFGGTARAYVQVSAAHVGGGPGDEAAAVDVDPAPADVVDVPGCDAAVVDLQPAAPVERVVVCDRVLVHGHDIIADRFAADRVCHEIHDRAVDHVHAAAVFRNGSGSRTGGNVHRRHDVHCHRIQCAVRLDRDASHVKRGIRSLSAAVDIQSSARDRDVGRRARHVEIASGDGRGQGGRTGSNVEVAAGDRGPGDRRAFQDVHVSAPVPVPVEQSVFCGPAGADIHPAAADVGGRVGDPAAVEDVDSRPVCVEAVPGCDAAVVDLQPAAPVERVLVRDRVLVYGHDVTADGRTGNRVRHELDDRALDHVDRTTGFPDLNRRGVGRNIDRIVDADFRKPVHRAARIDVHRGPFSQRHAARHSTVVHVHRCACHVDVGRLSAAVDIQSSARDRDVGRRARHVEIASGDGRGQGGRTGSNVEVAAGDRGAGDRCAGQNVQVTIVPVAVVERVFGGPAGVNGHPAAADECRCPGDFSAVVDLDSRPVGICEVPGGDAAVEDLQLAAPSERVLVRDRVLMDRHRVVADRRARDRVRHEIHGRAFCDVHRAAVFPDPGRGAALGNGQRAVDADRDAVSKAAVRNVHAAAGTDLRIGRLSVGRDRDRIVIVREDEAGGTFAAGDDETCHDGNSFRGGLNGTQTAVDLQLIVVSRRYHSTTIRQMQTDILDFKKNMRSTAA